MELTATDWGSLVSAGILTESEVEAVFGGAQTLTEVLSRDGCAEVFEKLRGQRGGGHPSHCAVRHPGGHGEG